MKDSDILPLLSLQSSQEVRWMIIQANKYSNDRLVKAHES